eukprot:TRINITY_DN8539_c0_g1_i1.p1 TRINITY_DN8539_c0_g1~~TRINITY_DN8539_c0_g1_i1.p1  ORF type:complete len:884 (-),score=132.86 TRINITY_DN8539_c0_g1_i1:635-3286(-)
MVHPKKASSKKQKNRGIDFKKIKSKLGRKLPPKNNATNTQVKSKAIVLPEQSVASERAGLAVSKKGLTLKELLQKTSHHNAKVRRDALNGMKDFSIKYASELKSHKLVIMEKLCERLSDDDKVVRETLYQLLDLVIFPCFKEDIPGHIISLMMAYIFNAMTHIANDIRIMAFKFFNLLVEHYPSSFFSYADKVLQNYEDILRNNLKYLQDKSRFKVVLGGLVCCLSLLACDKRKSNQSHEKVSNVRRALHAFEPELPKEETGASPITKKLKDLLLVLVNCFQEIFPLVCRMPSAETQSFDCMLSILQSINHTVKYFVYKMDKACASHGCSMHNGPNMTTWSESSIPALLKKLFEAFPLNRIYHSTEKEDHRSCILNIEIAEIFLHLNDWIGCPAILMERFLEFIENVMSWQEIWMLVEEHIVALLPFIPRLILQVPTDWKLRLLEAFTIAFKGSRPESTLKLACLSAIEEMLIPRQGVQLFHESNQDIMGYQANWIQELPQLLLQLGVRHPSTSRAVLHLQLRMGQCTPMQSPLSIEYDNMQWELTGFFSKYLKERKFPTELKELAICCLYYFSRLNSTLLESLAHCCLCDDLEPFVICRAIEVLHSAYKAGHVQITDQISFLVTLIARFKVFPRMVCNGAENDGNISNRATFKAIMNEVCSSLSQMGDGALILKILQKTILNEMSLKPPLDNMRAMLRMVVMLDSKPTRLSEEIMGTLSYYLFGYLVDAAAHIPDNINEKADFDWKSVFQYYAQPALIMFERSDKLLSLVLNLLGSSMVEHDSTRPLHDVEYACQLTIRVHAVAFILIFMHKNVKVHQSLFSCASAIKCILQNILSLLASNEINMTLQERHKIQYAFEQLKVETGRIHLWDADDFKETMSTP